MTLRRSRRTRLIGGLPFECHAPGHWLGADGRLAILHLMQSTRWSEWHLFRTRPGKIPRKPFESGAAFWAWDDLVYALSMDELNGELLTLRERSRAMLPLLVPKETVVRCGRSLRLVTAVHLDGDGIGAVLDVESDYQGALTEQWSTYGCTIEKLSMPWPKRKAVG